jgi:hypothetical protein
MSASGVSQAPRLQGPQAPGSSHTRILRAASIRSIDAPTATFSHVRCSSHLELHNKSIHPSFPRPSSTMSGGFPKNFEELQRTLQNAQQQGRRFGAGGGGGPPGGPRAIAGLLGLVALGGGVSLLSNSLFNGRF